MNNGDILFFVSDELREWEIVVILFLDFWWIMSGNFQWNRIKISLSL